ncbi:MAG: hypothetical protein ACUVSF_03990 [Anaerolineae bacterium]
MAREILGNSVLTISDETLWDATLNARCESFFGKKLLSKMVNLVLDKYAIM